ncbi:hypothetical protein P168DRAFT_16074 [Aspergillus campestris IBT 28561]|uniref:Uncharacterized protein n=1 Tax=Aspergillus campestris (strain IBT 28561) TaxID=1392248 RepID=A0A2I1DET8_ASPC2|nr:uncharacterized protein P168DRAFT_16074 [Aspergillus campestris IBT 28561]PKY08399.1 hypothetical protein P168DRAFT_16074 [Aspergillus campestris IBT 28561]
MTRLYAFKTVRHENYVILHDQRQQISTTTFTFNAVNDNLYDNLLFRAISFLLFTFPKAVLPTMFLSYTLLL